MVSADASSVQQVHLHGYWMVRDQGQGRAVQLCRYRAADPGGVRWCGAVRGRGNRTRRLQGSGRHGDACCRRTYERRGGCRDRVAVRGAIREYERSEYRDAALADQRQRREYVEVQGVGYSPPSWTRISFGNGEFFTSTGRIRLCSCRNGTVSGTR